MFGRGYHFSIQFDVNTPLHEPLYMNVCRNVYLCVLFLKLQDVLNLSPPSPLTACSLSDIFTQVMNLSVYFLMFFSPPLVSFWFAARLCFCLVMDKQRNTIQMAFKFRENQKKIPTQSNQRQFCHEHFCKFHPVYFLLSPDSFCSHYPFSST